MWRERESNTDQRDIEQLVHGEKYRPNVSKADSRTDPTLVTALIRYIYKELAKAVRPSYSSTKQRDSLSFTGFPIASLASVNPASSLLMWPSQRPMIVHLVGLGGSLEGRVAGVVLVLVGCKEITGQLCCSCSACVHLCAVVHVPLITSSKLSLALPTLHGASSMQ
jgi:hypothetical protein